MAAPTPDAEMPAVQEASGQRHVTLKDVARLAGVSPITVSRALTRPELVSQRARDKVRQAVEQTGYVPNSLAGGLTSKRTRLVAAIVPSVAHSLFSEMVQSLIDTLAAHEYHTMLGLSRYGAAAEEELVAAILSRRPDGIALTGIDHTPRAKKLLLAAAIPVVEMWDFSVNPLDMAVGFRHEELGAAAFRHLHDRGYRRPAILRADDIRAGRRAEGFLKAAAAAGLAPPTEVVFSETLPQAQRGREGLKRLLQRDPQADAVFCSSDALAQGVLAHAHEIGRPVPGSLGVLGFGNQALGADTVPALSSIGVDSRRLGELAALSLVQRMQGEEPAHAIQDLGFELVQRGST